MTVTGENATAVIVASIPELRTTVEGDEDLYHLTFGDLFHWVKTRTEAGNLSDLRRAIRLVDSIIQDCDSDIRNAIGVSFLEHVDPDDTVGREIFDHLTPGLQQLWQALDEHMQQLIGKSLRGSVSRAESSKKV